MKRILSILLFCVMAINMSYAQEEALSAEVTNATIENNCEDGAIDLTITGGFPPYDVIWNFHSNYPLKIASQKHAFYYLNYLRRKLQMEGAML